MHTDVAVVDSHAREHQVEAAGQIACTGRDLERYTHSRLDNGPTRAEAAAPISLSLRSSPLLFCSPGGECSGSGANAAEAVRH